MKRSVIASIVGVLAVLGIAAYVLLGGDDAPVVYRLGKVDVGSIVSTVSASGTIKPATSAVVSSQAAGQVKEVLADVNEEVTAGQVLARLDPDSAQARLDIALADLEVARQGVEVARGQVDHALREADNAQALQISAEADAKHAELTAVDARRDLKRKRKLVTTGDVAPVDTEHSETAYDAASAGVASAQARAAAAAAAFAAAQAEAMVAQAQLKNAAATVAVREAAVRQAQVDVHHTVLRSPIDGVVVERNVIVGQTVSGGPVAAPLFTIAGDLRHLQLHASVDEADVGRVAIGQPATFTFDAFPAQTFSGEVAEIWTQPQPLQSVVAYDVLIGADNTDRKLLPGMTADVRIIVGRRDDVLKVPNAALRFRPANHGSEMPTTTGGERQEARARAEVWRLDGDGRPHADPVHMGLTDGVFTEVTDGDLAKGDEVVVGASQSTGANVKVGPLKF
jgi:HlyD family secretion protein